MRSGPEYWARATFDLTQWDVPIAQCLAINDNHASETSKCYRDAKGPLEGKNSQTASLHLHYWSLPWEEQFAFPLSSSFLIVNICYKDGLVPKHQGRWLCKTQTLAREGKTNHAIDQRKCACSSFNWYQQALCHVSGLESRILPGKRFLYAA